MKAKLIKYDLDYTHYSTEMGSVHLPCPPIFFDANLERGYIEDIKKKAIFCNIEPIFLIHKFVNVVSPQQALRLRRQWDSFKATNPVAHNTDEASSGRSSGTASYHLGIWRRSSKVALITADTRCTGQPFDIHQHIKLKNFLRSVQRYVASPLEHLLGRYVKKESVKRKRQVGFVFSCHAPDNSAFKVGRIYQGASTFGQLPRVGLQGGIHNSLSDKWHQ